MGVQINKDMFRHSDSIRQQERHNDFLSEDKINNSIRYFKVPAVESKFDVVKSLLSQINELNTIRLVKNKLTTTLKLSSSTTTRQTEQLIVSKKIAATLLAKLQPQSEWGKKTE